jgi:hypothetical protein
LLDDAAPIFRNGSQVPGVGVLLALPCLIESGVLRIARKLYGDVNGFVNPRNAGGENARFGKSSRDCLNVVWQLVANFRNRGQ